MQNKATFRRLLGILAAALILTVGGYMLAGYWGSREVQAGGPLPGSNEDPLVTKSYVDQYVNERIQKLQQALDQAQARLNNLEQEVAALKKKISELPTAGMRQVILLIGSKTAFVNGAPVQLTVAPYQDAATGTTMVPFRFVGEALGATVGYDAQSQTVSYNLGAKNVILKIGAKQGTINGSVQDLPAAPRLVEGTTMVPLRVVGQGLGAEVRWDATAKSITITLF
ncbi:MAG: stalk domain-containing protein [Moorellaceae bacterium]